MLTYICKASGLDFTPRYNLASNPDIQAIGITTSLEPFIVLNVYNERERLESPLEGPVRLGRYTVNRLLQFIQLDQPALIAGDFNLYHP